MSERDDDDVVIPDIEVQEVHLEPSALVTIHCGTMFGKTCGHPIVARSQSAMQSSREDHVNYVHWARGVLPEFIEPTSAQLDAIELLSADDPEPHDADN
jgi:hypothetical protein